MTEQEKRENVIKGLECCMVGDGHSPKCELCPYATVGDDTCQTMDVLFSDALALLKAQEAVDAIPVEWLESKERELLECEDKFNYRRADSIRLVILMWQKEQEAR